MQTRALASQHETAVLPQIELRVIRGAALVQPHNPDVLLLHLLQRPGQVRHTSDSHMLHRAGGALRHNGTERSRPPLRQDHPCDACTVG